MTGESSLPPNFSKVWIQPNCSICYWREKGEKEWFGGGGAYPVLYSRIHDDRKNCLVSINITTHLYLYRYIHTVASPYNSDITREERDAQREYSSINFLLEEGKEGGIGGEGRRSTSSATTITTPNGEIQ